MKKLVLLFVSVMLVLCMAGCTPKSGDSLDAKIKQSQSDLERLKENAERANREYDELMDSLERIDRLEDALSNARP